MELSRIRSGTACHSLPVEGAATVRFLTVQGFDDPVQYDRYKFRRAKEALLNIDKVQSELTWISHHWPSGDARILLIQRGPSHPFYHSERSENKGSGQERRSIANHGELYRALRQRHVGCLNIMTEGLTLARQIALFSSADVIIAQHGAALANAIWAQPTATVIEILPPKWHSHYDFFYNLSRCLGLRYRRVWQEDDHGDVDVGEITQITTKIIETPTSMRMSELRSAAFRASKPTFVIRRWLRSFASRACGKAWRMARKVVTNAPAPGKHGT